ncbi:hypothetical protein A0H81_11488 [Grifola frondosa]|uniref:Uncharacterized protein n=1 Tax=Grifola frondosa TaxID=5627 RepID=A0A1C7LUI9_GRIFR|nr:hypothetical protein A0H81_11488 [Grifola frondosa]
MAASNYYSHDWNAVFVFADHAAQSILLWPVALLLISAFYLYRSLYPKSSNTAQHVSLLTKQITGPSPEEGISMISNGYALEHVPFDVGDVRVTKLLVHPIKVCRAC